MMDEARLAQVAPVFYEFPIESTLPNKTLKRLRFYPQLTLVVAQNILLAGAAVLDWVDFSNVDSKIFSVQVSVADQPVRAIALWFFLVQLLLDSAWVLAAIYFGGISVLQFKQLWPILSHHIGFCMLTARVSFQQLDYVAGLAFVGILSEFTVPLKLWQAYHFSSKEDDDEGSGSNISSSTLYQLRLLGLDMFLTGGATFAAASNYALILGDNQGLLSTKTKTSYTIILTLAIVYWSIQLVGNHRVKLERLMARLLMTSSTVFVPLERNSKTMSPAATLERSKTTDNDDDDHMMP